MTRERRVWLLAGAAVLAAVIVGVAVAISQGGADDDDSAQAPPQQVESVAQDGISLGDPNADATLIEFADLQCPFCAEFATEQLPGVIDEYVRTGRVRLELRLLAFIGPDSQRARGVANAAALQDRMWDYTDRFFRDQGAENSGYATNAFLTRLARQTPGLDLQQLREDIATPEAAALAREAEQLAKRLQVDGTPSFYLVRDGGQPEPVELENLDEALAGG